MGKLVSEVEIKSNGEMFLELMSEKPHHISRMSPDKVQHCGLLHGDWGQVGSGIFWNYTHEDKEKVAKVILEDKGDKMVKFRVIEGDILEVYKSFSSTIEVKNNGVDNFIVWTLDYEKSNPNVPDPHTLMDFALHLTKDFDAHFNLNPN